MISAIAGRSKRRHLIRQAMAVLIVASSVGVVALTRSANAAVSVADSATIGATAVMLNQPADPFLKKVAPSADADVKGMYSPQAAWPLVGIHAALMPNGHVVTYGSPKDTASQGGIVYDDWDPALGTGTDAHQLIPSMHHYNAFCNALEMMPDGRVLMVGGNSTTASMTYNYQTGEQAMGSQLAQQRWYASLLRLPDDRMLVLGGANYYNTGAYRTPDNDAGVATTPEIGTGMGAWKMLTGARSSTAFGARDNRWWYPRAYVAPDGNVFGVSFDQMWSMNTAGTGSIRSLGTLPSAIGVSGSSVMYAPGRLLFAGGGQRFNATNEAATNAATLIDINGTNPAVTVGKPMATPRNWLNLTVLSNGEVFANGGTKVGTGAGADNAANTAEVWNPATGTWRAAATAKRIRTYHSTSLRLPSGAVLTTGGGLPGPETNFNSEIYYPSFMFAKDATGKVVWANRPEIRTISGAARYGGTVQLGMSDTRAIRSMSLTKIGTVTHSYNTDQRQIPLTMTQKGATVSATIPNNRNVVPPGSYLLQGVDQKGVPTPSQIITIKRDGSAGTVTRLGRDQAPGAGDQGGTTAPGTVALTPGTTIGMESVNYPGKWIRHEAYTGVLSTVNANSSAVAKADSSFRVRAGLADASCVSFESVNYPGLYLRHRSFVVRLDKRDGTVLFNADATFCPQAGLTGQFTSLRSYNYPKHFMRHRNFKIYIDPFDGTDLNRRDSTFAVRAGLAS